MRYIIEVKVRVQNCTQHFEARQEILGEHYDLMRLHQRHETLVHAVDSLRDSLLPEITKANERLGS